MKRDMDLVRDILLYIEDNYSAGDDTIDVRIDEVSNSVIYEHCILIYEAGLIQKLDNWYTDAFGDHARVGNLTNEGYDYLDKIRDNTIWTNVKSKIKEKGLPLVIGTIKTIASAFITAAAEGVTNSILKKT